ncbi:uncharacterized protein FYW61_016130 [Anableps anableps]
MKKNCQSLMAALSENMLTVNLLLSVFFLSDNVVFNSSNSVTTYPMNITGILKKNNCTTLFFVLDNSHQDKYYFRIMNWPFRATANCNPVKITVKDSPWKPSINISGGLTNLKEHQSVTITCSALTPCPHSPPELTWNLQQDSHRQTEKNTDGTLTTKIQEIITLSDTHDEYNISCSARYPVNGGSKTAETEVTLNVSYAPKDTSASISPSGLVSAGSWVELNCSSRAKPPPSFTWFRNSKDGAVNVSVGQVYSFNVTQEAEYFCVTTNDLGNQTSSTPSSEEAAVQTPSTAEEELQYGEVTFFKRKPEASTTSVEDNKQEETVYAPVKVSKSTKCSTQTTDSPEDLYAQVKKK